MRGAHRPRRVRRFRDGAGDATATRLCSIPRTALRNSGVRERKAGIAGGFAGMFAAVAGDTSAGIVATGAPPTPAFDAFSVGLVLLRAAVPALHPPGAMKLGARRWTPRRSGWKQGRRRRGTAVLGEWAVSPGSASCDFGLLDEVGGWELVEGLATWDPERRMTLQEAAEHPCLRED